jgi:hypothetical protein
MVYIKWECQQAKKKVIGILRVAMQFMKFFYMNQNLSWVCSECMLMFFWRNIGLAFD